MLPPDKLPSDFAEGRPCSFSSCIDRLWKQPRNIKHLKTDPDPEGSGDFVPALGTEDAIYNDGADTGLFGTIFKVWANHWDLRTCPEDWWWPLITNVAAAIDKHSGHEAVRAFFVNGREEKETLTVSTQSFGIYDADYSVLFERFSEAINDKIQVPGYVNAITADFSTTCQTKRMTSQIAIMKSVQSYFEYTMNCPGCGIRALQMVGTQHDWASLGVKLETLHQLLQPIEHVLKLNGFLKVAREVFAKLHMTYVDAPSMCKWWADILMQGEDFEYGPSGIKRKVDCYNGWLVKFLGRGMASFTAEKLAGGEYAKHLSGLTSCAVRIELDPPGGPRLEDSAVVVAGMVGFSTEHVTGGLVVLQPAHGWCVLLSPHSALRQKTPSLDGTA